VEKSFPHCGKNGPDFSTPWKIFPEVFHAMENPAAAGPHVENFLLIAR